MWQKKYAFAIFKERESLHTTCISLLQKEIQEDAESSWVGLFPWTYVCNFSPFHDIFTHKQPPPPMLWELYVKVISTFIS